MFTHMEVGGERDAIFICICIVSCDFFLPFLFFVTVLWTMRQVILPVFRLLL